MNFRNILHLYSRAGFGISYDAVQARLKLDKKEVVSSLFSASSTPTPLTIDLSEFEPLMNSSYRELRKSMNENEAKSLRKKSRQKIKEFNYAWINRLANSEEILNEKMTLFWANVFVCRDYTVWHAQHYNNTLRKFALGDFGDFVKAISKEASMSKYLNNRQNRKHSPNENFARELMELFTLGVGNYTEQDIKEAARAFTGYNFVPNGSFRLRAFQHDDGIKTFMGKEGNFNGDDIIDIILEQKQCARFICSKIYTYFINPVIDQEKLKILTDRFYGNYNIKDLMNYIFSSEWFYDDNNIGVKIKSPIELLVGIKRIVPFEFQRPRQLIYIQKIMGQTLLDPPNVAGWKGGRNWIDPNSLMIRLKLAAILLNDAEIDVDIKGEFEDDFEDYYMTKENRGRVIKTTKDWENFEKYYGILKPEVMRKLLITSEMDVNTEEFLSKLNVNDMKAYCIQLMSLPEYQLC